MRSQNRRQQAVRWLCAAGLAAAAYVVVSRLACGLVSFDLTEPQHYRIFMPVLAAFLFVAWETRWDGVVREEEERKGTDGAPAKPGVDVGAKAEPPSAVQVPQASEAPEPAETPRADVTAPVAGEEEYRLARSMPHGAIPDLNLDAEYLELLGKSAAAGYAPAMAKFGEYAMRRSAWVEAYYWMKLAQLSGMRGLSPTLLEIRKNWSMSGFPDQFSNVNEIFTFEAGSLGRALLHVDSGRDAARAREYIRANHPEFPA